MKKQAAEKTVKTEKTVKKKGTGYFFRKPNNRLLHKRII
jgi:hypothetical protein